MVGKLGKALCCTFLFAILGVDSAFGVEERGLMVSALVSGSSGLGWSLGRGRCVVLLVKTLYSHSASLHLSA